MGEKQRLAQDQGVVRVRGSDTRWVFGSSGFHGGLETLGRLQPLPNIMMERGEQGSCSIAFR